MNVQEFDSLSGRIYALSEIESSLAQIEQVEDMAQNCLDLFLSGLITDSVKKHQLHELHTDTSTFMNSQNSGFNGANDHSISHIDRVLEYEHSFLTKSGMANSFSEDEAFFLAYSTILHDLGNLVRRQGHAQISAALIRKIRDTQFFPHNIDWLDIQSKIVACHSDNTRIGRIISEEDAIDLSSNVSIRAQLIASVLRLCDELDEDHRRGPKNLLEIKMEEGNFPPTSIVYWRFNQIISSVVFSKDPLRLTLRISCEADELRQQFLKQDRTFITLGGFVAEKITKIFNTVIYCNEFFPPEFRICQLEVNLDISENGKTLVAEKIPISYENSFGDFIGRNPYLIIGPNGAAGNTKAQIENALLDVSVLCRDTLGKGLRETVLIGSSARLLANGSSTRPDDLDFILITDGSFTNRHSDRISSIIQLMRTKYNWAVSIDSISYLEVVTGASNLHPLIVSAIRHGAYAEGNLFFQALCQIHLQFLDDNAEISRSFLKYNIKESAVHCFLGLTELENAEPDTVAHRCMQALWSGLQFAALSNAPEDSISMKYLDALSVPDELTTHALATGVSQEIVTVFFNIRKTTILGQPSNLTSKEMIELTLRSGEELQIIETEDTYPTS